MTDRQKKDLFSLLRQVNATLGRGPRQGLSVKPGQNKILHLLAECGSLSQTELLQRLGIRSSSLYELLQKLENDGLITRQRGKQFNALIVDITEKGHIAAFENELSNKERDIAFFGKLNKEDKDDLTRILNTLLDTWEEIEVTSNENDGKSRERRWKENEQLQDRERSEKKALANKNSKKSKGGKS